MGDGSKQPETFAQIYKNARLITEVRLNATTFCAGQPYGTGDGLMATDDQIIAATLGDEDILTGTPGWPEHHDEVLS